MEGRCMFCEDYTQDELHVWAYPEAPVKGVLAFNRESPKTGFMEWAASYIRPAEENKQKAAILCCLGCAAKVATIQVGWVVFQDGKKEPIGY